MRSGARSAFCSGPGAGKTTVRMDKVNVALGMFGIEAAPARSERQENAYPKKDFFVFAEECGISKPSAEKMIAKIVSMKPKHMDMCYGSRMPDHLKERFAELIEQRCKILE